MTTTPYDSPILKEIPSGISSEDRQRLTDMGTQDLVSRVVLFEEMIERYSDYPESQPFFLVRLADFMCLLKSRAVALDLYSNAQVILSRMNITEKQLDTMAQLLAAEVDEEANQGLTKSRQRNISLTPGTMGAYSFSYFQKWKPAKEHKFPTSLPHLPQGSQEILAQWQKLSSKASAAYFTKLAIETNHVEGVFLLSEGSAKGLIQHGIAEGAVHCLPQSAIQDPDAVKSILNDMLATCNLLHALVDDVESLDKDIICRMHTQLMRTCRFSHPYTHYIPAGKTRTETRSTVVISGVYAIECCPFPEVDSEVAYICKMAKQWIKSWRNPFATASWFHMVLASCHPFEDGNGRIVRLLASIPLMQHGYPPISISLSQRADYYVALNKAREGDHTPLVQCILQGMREAMVSVESL